MWIRAGDIKTDDVIAINKEDRKVAGVEKYTKQKRKWVTVYLATERDRPDLPDDVAIPADVMVPWHGTALF